MSIVEGLRIAFVGWTEHQGAEYANALRQDGGNCEWVDHTARQTIDSADLVILRIGGNVVPATTECTLLNSCRCPVLVVGDEAALQPVLPMLRQRHRGFVFDSCTVGEFQMRVSVLVPRGGDAQTAQRQTVVVADDDRITRALIEAWLVKAGFTCHSAGDGETALELTRRLRPAAIVLDVYMPRRNGFAVLQEIRQEPAIANTRVLMLTGSAEQDNVRRASALHADAYMVKPLQGAKLVERLKKLLDQAA
jgi:DNA-binding response OmpR family regulator